MDGWAMSFTALLSETLTVLRYEAGAVDDYGNVTSSWAAADQIKGRLEQRSGEEVTRDQQTYTSDWVLFTESDVVLTVEDRVSDSYGRTFEVLSLAQQLGARTNHHLVVSLRHTDSA